ncbi:unnamed protein product [Closterium sp. NIES-65]|nr:unnamed protein product [Closterium sp. NIES-65]
MVVAVLGYGSSRGSSSSLPHEKPPCAPHSPHSTLAPLARLAHDAHHSIHALQRVSRRLLQESPASPSGKSLPPCMLPFLPSPRMRAAPSPVNVYPPSIPPSHLPLSSLSSRLLLLPSRAPARPTLSGGWSSRLQSHPLLISFLATLLCAAIIFVIASIGFCMCCRQGSWLVVCCHALPCAAMRCRVLPCAAVCCHALPCAAMRCRVLPCAAVCCHALPCAAMRCRVLPCAAVCCHALPCAISRRAESSFDEVFLANYIARSTHHYDPLLKLGSGPFGESFPCSGPEGEPWLVVRATIPDGLAGATWLPWTGAAAKRRAFNEEIVRFSGLSHPHLLHLIGWSDQPLGQPGGSGRLRQVGESMRQWAQILWRKRGAQEQGGGGGGAGRGIGGGSGRGEGEGESSGRAEGEALRQAGTQGRAEGTAGGEEDGDERGEKGKAGDQSAAPSNCRVEVGGERVGKEGKGGKGGEGVREGRKGWMKRTQCAPEPGGGKVGSGAWEAEDGGGAAEAGTSAVAGGRAEEAAGTGAAAAAPASVGGRGGGGGRELLLLYEWSDQKTLCARLQAQRELMMQGRDSDAQSAQPLAFSQRLDIASAIAEALCHLHTVAQPPLVHRRLCSSSVFLEVLPVARLANLGIIKGLPSSPCLLQQCHVAAPHRDPDWWERMWPTTRTDIYSLGIIMLELLSGCPATTTDHATTSTTVSLDVHQMLASIATDDLAAVLDPSISAQSMPFRPIRSFARLATRCAAPAARSRPDISTVVSELQGISRAMIRLSMARTTAHNSFVSRADSCLNSPDGSEEDSPEDSLAALPEDSQSGSPEPMQGGAEVGGSQEEVFLRAHETSSC